MAWRILNGLDLDAWEAWAYQQRIPWRQWRTYRRQLAWGFN